MSIQYDIPMVDYLAIDALSSGVAHRVITQSPLHALHSKLTPRDPSSASCKGELIHRLLLEGHEDDIVLVPFDDWRKKEAQTLRDAAYAEGKVPILDREMPTIRLAVQRADQFIEQSEIAGVFDSGQAEVTVDWNDNGVLCKARPDYLSDEFHVSVKTTNVVGGANPAYFSRYTLSNMGYDFSQMFYRRGLEANDVFVKHRILVVEQNKPHGCCLISLSPSKEAIGNADVERAIDIWRECERSKYYPAYQTETFEAEALPWELAAAEQRELEYMAVGA